MDPILIYVIWYIPTRMLMSFVSGIIFNESLLSENAFETPAPLLLAPIIGEAILMITFMMALIFGVIAVTFFLPVHAGKHVSKKYKERKANKGKTLGMAIREGSKGIKPPVTKYNRYADGVGSIQRPVKPRPRNPPPPKPERSI